jgi:hypothetical protein
MPAKRAYGMDQDFYPWSPTVTRPVFRLIGKLAEALGIEPDELLKRSTERKRN